MPKFKGKKFISDDVRIEKRTVYNWSVPQVLEAIESNDTDSLRVMMKNYPYVMYILLTDPIKILSLLPDVITTRKLERIATVMFKRTEGDNSEEVIEKQKEIVESMAAELHIGEKFINLPERKRGRPKKHNKKRTPKITNEAVNNTAVANSVDDDDDWDIDNEDSEYEDFDEFEGTDIDEDEFDDFDDEGDWDI